MRRVLLPVLFGFLFSGVNLFADSNEFTILAPDGWAKNEKSTALAQYQKGTGSFIVTADVMPSDANTPDKYIEFIKAQYSKTFEKCTFESVTAGKKDKYETRELKYYFMTSGMKMIFDVLYVFKGGKAYTLTSGNAEMLIDDTFASDIKSFFTSFKLK